MPQLEIRTNLRLSQIPADFNQKTTELVASTLEKPPNLTMVTVMPNQLVTLGGSNEPCAVVNLYSIGNVSPDENRENCKKFAAHLESELNISPSRVFINFFDVPACNLAWNNRIFEDILRDPSFLS